MLRFTTSINSVATANLVPAALFWLVTAVLVLHASQAVALGARDVGRQSLNLAPVNVGLPNGVVYFSEDLPRLVWVDLQQGLMYLLEQQAPGEFAQPVAIPVSLGKKGYGKRKEGDLLTPVGVYHVTSYLPDRQLDSKYGDGAFPVNYPSAFDILQRRTGSGIWLHGLPKGVASRPLLDSDGCVVVDNTTLGLLKPLIAPQETMVVLARALTFTEQQPANYQTFLTTLEAWHEDWESLDHDRYLRHYAAEFTDMRRNLEAWQRYKRRVNGRKDWIKVELGKLSAIAHPEHPDLITVRYYQEYRSSNYNWHGWKQMLWREQENGQWQIVYEGNR
jgi:murein L,D-transpeptidase YafK